MDPEKYLSYNSEDINQHQVASLIDQLDARIDDLSEWLRKSLEARNIEVCRLAQAKQMNACHRTSIEDILIKNSNKIASTLTNLTEYTTSLHNIIKQKNLLPTSDITDLDELIYKVQGAQSKLNI